MLMPTGCARLCRRNDLTSISDNSSIVLVINSRAEKHWLFWLELISTDFSGQGLLSSFLLPVLVILTSLTCGSHSGRRYSCCSMVIGLVGGSHVHHILLLFWLAVIMYIIVIILVGSGHVHHIIQQLLFWLAVIMYITLFNSYYAGQQ